MNREAILARLRASEGDLRARGVAHAALFGSRAREDHRSDNDIDIMIEMAPDVHIGLYQYVEIVHAIEDLFPFAVDVSNRDAQKSHVRPSVERDAIYVF